ncbi:DUF3152 domain-containing protein [Streptomyces sp. NPDC005899]|uniref:DUF3152 domain-containing protein n=1 Tax=Streptomyces sp. NPDC005899 TaxID=3155716 RepID=UPI0033CD7BDE
MGRHSRKEPELAGHDTGAAAPAAGEAGAARAGNGRRRRDAGAQAAGGGGHDAFHDVPRARGGHPEQREPGGGWGTGPQTRDEGRDDGPGPSPEARARQALARQLSAQQAARSAAERRSAPGRRAAASVLIPGPRREFVDAFEAAGSRTTRAVQAGGGTGTPDGPDRATEVAGDGGGGRDSKGGKGRTVTGIAAAAVTTVLAVVVAGQVAQESGSGQGVAQAAGADREGSGDASRSEERPTPQARKPEVKPLSYAAKMAEPYPLAPDLKASGEFQAVPGLAKAPGKGQKYRYRVDVEKGLGLDAGLFAEAVQKTLNDDRSWAHDGAMTFERISSGEPDFVITLASPGTTGVWCEKSGLDTTEDNVSCDSAATDRVMINAYRWAQGASTFGPGKLLIYRQMLINHEVGHRLGHDHASCATPGALAPVMQQQTKTLELKGIKCKPNPWVFPGS